MRIHNTHIMKIHPPHVCILLVFCSADLRVVFARPSGVNDNISYYILRYAPSRHD